jgi:hypothetical protein
MLVSIARLDKKPFRDLMLTEFIQDAFNPKKSDKDKTVNIGSLFVKGDNLKTFYLKGYQLIDISCSKSMYKNLIKLTIGGKNLLNVKNIQSSGTFVANGVHGTATNTMPVGWGASFFADIKINLNSALFKKSKL